jgi:hypothetical protein
VNYVSKYKGRSYKIMYCNNQPTIPLWH